MIKTHSIALYGFTLSCLLVSAGVASAGGFDITINSPLEAAGITTAEKLVTAILNALVVIVTPLVVLAIIYAGFMYVTARGNAEQIKKATTALTYAVIGGLLAIGAIAISEIIEIAIEDFRS